MVLARVDHFARASTRSAGRWSDPFTGGEDQVLPVHHRGIRAAGETGCNGDEVAVQCRNLLRVVGDPAVDRNGRSVNGLEVLQPGGGRPESVRAQGLPASDNVGDAVTEQRPHVFLVAPQRRRLRTDRRRRRVRLHHLEHLADEAIRSPTQYADRAPWPAHPEQLVRRRLMVRGEHDSDAGRHDVEGVVPVGQGFCVSQLPRQLHAVAGRKRPTGIEQLRGQVGCGHPGTGQRGRNRGIPRAGGHVEHPVPGADPTGRNESGPSSGITSMATAG